jgi:hypothetical protein
MSGEKMFTLVNGLVAIDFASISARVLVVELAETGCVEVRRDGQNPRGGDGVQRLVVVLVPSSSVHCNFSMHGGKWQYVRSCESCRGVRLPWRIESFVW